MPHLAKLASLFAQAALLGSLLHTGSAQADDTPAEACLSPEQLDERVERYKAGISHLQSRVESLESELKAATGPARPEPDPSAGQCQLQQSVLNELSTVRSTLAIRDDEVDRFAGRSQAARAETQQALERVRELERAAEEAQQQAPAAAPDTERTLEQQTWEIEAQKETIAGLRKVLESYELNAGNATAASAAASGLREQLQSQQATLDEQAQTIADLRAALERRPPPDDEAALAAAELADAQAQLETLRTLLEDYEMGRTPTPQALELQAALAQQVQELADQAQTIEDLRAELDRGPAAQTTAAAPPQAAAVPAEAVATRANSAAREFLDSLPASEAMPSSSAHVLKRAEVYEAPSADSALVGLLSDGRQLEVLRRSVGSEPRWYQIRVPRGAQGWVVSDQIELDEEG